MNKHDIDKMKDALLALTDDEEAQGRILEIVDRYAYEEDKTTEKKSMSLVSFSRGEDSVSKALYSFTCHKKKSTINTKMEVEGITGLIVAKMHFEVKGSSWKEVSHQLARELGATSSSVLHFADTDEGSRPRILP